MMGQLGLRVGRDRYFKVLEARGTMMSMWSRKIGKAEKVDDGGVVDSPDPLMLCSSH